MLGPERSLEVLSVPGSMLPQLRDCDVRGVVGWACHNGCQQVSVQVDERDPDGRWVLDVGAQHAEDEQPGRVDDTDVILVAAKDLGRSTAHPPNEAMYELQVSDPLSLGSAVAYLGCATTGSRPGTEPRRRVAADPQQDRIAMERLTVGFQGAIPTWLSIDGGPNVLDRVKVRARAKFLLGLVTVRRDETHLRGEVLGWRLGPLRVIRSQRQWVALGWGLRTPVFESAAFFYPEHMEIPVALRLRFPATYFFSDIRIQAYVDFRDLRGWQVLVPPNPNAAVVDGHMTAPEVALNGADGNWFVLRGPQLWLLQFFDVSPSLQSVKRRFLYRDDANFRAPPESFPGELPAVGYELTDWRQVGSGVHALHAMSFVLPSDADPERFLLAQRHPLRVEVRPLFEH